MFFKGLPISKKNRPTLGQLVYKINLTGNFSTKLNHYFKNKFFKKKKANFFQKQQISLKDIPSFQTFSPKI